MTSIGENMLWVLGAPTLGLIGVLAPVTWRILRERWHHQTLRAVTAQLPAQGQVEIDDLGRDGSRLRIHITTTTGTPRLQQPDRSRDERP